MHRSRSAPVSRAVTFDEHYVPQSRCHVCGHGGAIVMCTRLARFEEYVFKCTKCRARWKILL